MCGKSFSYKSDYNRHLTVIHVTEAIHVYFKTTLKDIENASCGNKCSLHMLCYLCRTKRRIFCKNYHLLKNPAMTLNSNFENFMRKFIIWKRCWIYTMEQFIIK